MSTSATARFRTSVKTVQPPRRPHIKEPWHGMTREQLARHSVYVRDLIRVIDSHKLCRCCGDPFQPRDERVRYCGRCGN